MIKKIRRLLINYIPMLVKSSFIYKMPFLYPLLEIKPSAAVIMLTNRCNLKCVICKQWQEVPREELTTEDWKEIIKDLKKNGIKSIHFTGGEPLLRRDLCELIQYSSQEGFAVGITTNGLLLQQELLQNLINAGLRSIAISLDALKEKYEYLRGVPDTFLRVKDTLSLVADTGSRRKIDAYINFTLLKNTIEDFKDVKGLADDFKLPIAVCLLDKNSSIFRIRENKDKFWITDEDDPQKLNALLNFLKEEKIKRPSSLLLSLSALDYIAAYFKDPVQKDIPCIVSQDRVFIGPYGDMFGGCLSMGSFGNFRDTQFDRLVKREKYKRAKRNMFYKECSGCSCGYFFNIQHFPPLIIRDYLIRSKNLISRNA